MSSQTAYKVLFYEREIGGCPTREFLSSLPLKVRAKISKWIEKLEEYGPDLPRPYADIVRGKIRELRIVFSSTQYRLLYFFHGKYIIITHGFIKKTDKVPDIELEKAQNLMRDFELKIKKGDIKI